MRAAQTIWRPGRAGSWLLLLAACHSTGKRPEPVEPVAPVSATPVSSAPTPGALAAASAIADTLRSVHAEKLAVTAPSVQPAPLAFGPGRLLEATAGKVILRDVTDGRVIADAPLAAFRAMARGRDGALFALGLESGLRFEAASAAPKSFPHATFFPGSSLFPDLEHPDHFYVYDSEQASLYRYPFEAEGGALLPIDAQFSLEGCVSALALLRDGAFVCRSSGGIARRAPRGRKSELKLPAGVAEPLRLLPAKRLDEIFAVSRSGEVTHLRLENGTPVLGRFQLPAPPFAASANADALAFILVSPPAPGAPRHWALLVTDFDGQPRFQTDLVEKTASAEDDWLQAVVLDKNLAISEYDPLVAVGGGEKIWVWDYAQRRQVFAR
jgi:hypothetical protein